ncbi:phosphotransferase family protein [Limibaculum sp. FT325]|uniref:choline/ethanolamine kinase family protein n=1 Tax=Thermohalobaculum sediminis TaxID=2939436 RepID=UPI0020C03D39|nr:choline/ethanolamine kinase family protein [Limibaculum sediminis]MCL5776946.1 phosphotransferase family protein [Limibaculum sediminis]
MTSAIERARALPIWAGPVDPEPLGGGITNVNFVVNDGGRRAVVRIGEDIPVHQVMRFNELAASRAAHAAGISPPVLYHEPGALVIGFIEGRTLAAEDVRAPGMLERILPLVARAHREIPRHLRGPALVFWVFHVIRDYAATLTTDGSRHAPALPGLLATAERLEAAVGSIDLAFGHNDLLPANLIDDGARLWLIDWDYAGFNSGLFDLGGLAANNGLSPDQEAWVLETYFGRPPDPTLWRRYRAMKVAAALRETLWSMVSEIHSELDFDFAAYTDTNMAAFRAALDAFEQS